jgi:predicted nucleotidyltransferase
MVRTARTIGWNNKGPKIGGTSSSTVYARKPVLGSGALASLGRRYGIRRLLLFGSTLKGAARPGCDVDLRVEFEPDARPSPLTTAEIECALLSLLGGRNVDLRTAQDLSRDFREDVVRAEPQYEP